MILVKKMALDEWNGKLLIMSATLEVNKYFKDLRVSDLYHVSAEHHAVEMCYIYDVQYLQWPCSGEVFQYHAHDNLKKLAKRVHVKLPQSGFSSITISL